MKNLLYLLSIITLMSCSEPPEDQFVKEKLKTFFDQSAEVNYKKEGETILASFEDNYVSGKLEIIKSWRVVVVGNERPMLAIYEESNGIWTPLFKDEFIIGELEAFTDLNEDGIDEIIIKTSDSGTTTFTLYKKLKTNYVYSNRITEFQESEISNHKIYSKRIQGSFEIVQTNGTPSVKVRENIEWVENGNTFTINKNYLLSYFDRRYFKMECLEIVGKDIWVRDEPATGEVVMKLNDGDYCKILDKAKFEIIRNMPGYWYKIQFDGKEGWVFGSQTTLASETSGDTFNSLQEAIDKYAFDTADNPEHDGDHIICSHTGTFKEENFALLSFDQPGPMAGLNFSKGGFLSSTDNKWLLYSFLGEQLTSFEKGGKKYIVTSEYSSAGAYRQLNKFHLYQVDYKSKSFRNVQTIYEMGVELDHFEISGTATLVSTDNYETLQITEDLRHDIENVRKGIFTYKYKFDSKAGMYKLESRQP